MPGIREIRFNLNATMRYVAPNVDTEGTEDVVTARRMSLDHQAIAQALQVVGYLLMHTRQLDVIMADRAAFAHYGEKNTS